MEPTYTGWIPTVLGNLSFKSIGHSGYPYPFTLSSKEDINTGEITIKCLQKRVPSDYQIPLIPLPDKIYLDLCTIIASKVFKENIETAFLLIGSGTKDDTGTVQNLNGKIYKISKSTLLEQKKSYLYLEKIIQNKLKTEADTLESYLDDEAFFVCDFSLNRQGICNFNSHDVLRDGQGCHFGATEIYKTINQCFFFIKDAFHSHKHHDKSEDTLIKTHLTIDSFGVSWSDHVLKELYRYVLKQRPSLDKNSLGIFSYIRTFNKIITNKYDEKKEKTTLFSRTIALDELEKSISIQIDKKDEAISYRRWFAGFSLALMQITSFYIFSSNKAYYSGIIENNIALTITLAISLLAVVLVCTRNIHPRYWKNTVRFINLIISYFDSKNSAIFTVAIVGMLTMFLGFLLL